MQTATNLNHTFIRQSAPRAGQLAALAVLTAIAVPLVTQLPPGVGVMFALLLAVRAVLVWRHIAALPALWLWPFLPVCMGVVYWQVGTLMGREGGISFLLLMAVMKSFEGSTTRDWQVLLLTALFLMVGGLLFDQSLWIGLWVIATFYTLWLALGMLNHLSVARAARQAGLGFVLSLPLMALLFVLVPRLPEPLFRIPQQQKNAAQSGLSETLSPGSISRLIQQNTLVFNATFDAGYTPKPAQLYWRAMVMNDFDGRQWRVPGRQYIDAAPQNVPGTPVGYEIIGKDEDGYLAVLDYPLREADGTLFSTGATLRARRSYEQLRRLRLSGVVSDRLPEMLGDGERAFYTQLPAGVAPKTLQLAQELRAQAQDDDAVVQAGLKWLAQGGFRYTLTPPLLQSASPTDEFLFQTKQGFCEHFASAFAVLMRSARVPARIVAGYQGGQYHPDGGFWQVRSKDAHAWVEVWLSSDQSWHRIDPTAVAAANRQSGGIDTALSADEAGQIARPPAFIAEFAAKSQYYWQQWIVNFDADKQNDLFRRLGLGGFGLFSALTVLVVGGVLALLPMLWWWRHRQKKLIRPLPDGFLLLKRRLLLSGSLNDAQIDACGPLQLRELLHQSGEDSALIHTLIDDYIRLRYRSSEDKILPEHWHWYRRVKKLR